MKDHITHPLFFVASVVQLMPFVAAASSEHLSPVALLDVGSRLEPASEPESTKRFQNQLHSYIGLPHRNLIATEPVGLPSGSKMKQLDVDVSPPAFSYHK